MPPQVFSLTGIAILFTYVLMLYLAMKRHKKCPKLTSCAKRGEGQKPFSTNEKSPSTLLLASRSCSDVVQRGGLSKAKRDNDSSVRWRTATAGGRAEWPAAGGGGQGVLSHTTPRQLDTVAKEWHSHRWGRSAIYGGAKPCRL